MDTEQPKTEERSQDQYNKRPLWQWILLYLVIGVLAYGLLYYFVISGRSIGTPQDTPIIGNPNTGITPGVGGGPVNSEEFPISTEPFGY